MAQGPLDEGRRNHRCRDEAQGMGQIAAQDELEAIEQPGERRVVGGGDRRARAGGHENPAVGAAELEELRNRGEHACAELAVAGLHAEGRAGGVRDQGVEGEADAVHQRHPPAIKRVGLDRVDDVLGA